MPALTGRAWGMNPQPVKGPRVCMGHILVLGARGRRTVGLECRREPMRAGGDRQITQGLEVMGWTLTQVRWATEGSEQERIW